MIKSIELNETPVRTSKNFNANNIKINDIEIPDNISSFYNIDITEKYGFPFIKISSLAIL